MLVLSRGERQTIEIGRDIVVTVNRIQGGRVSIGIEAPREIPVVRGELPRREQRDKQPPKAA